ncbi:STAS domain-containing protein [Streptomyces inhibens]|uniref:STAS domain-containing protein n=1 Tax=Streptomyces inhibens TaxID=2293571 RepID=UPI001EE736E8|nr:STAS domain-containing protein [Streptomyces inhibens]UKY51266.1 STAS domain-containing protein [Streptomyces inhibens]
MTETEELRAVISRDDGRTTVRVAGEIDVVTASQLRRALETALSYGAGRIEVDFTSVPFCDCSGLNVLLWARRRATEQGSSFRVTGVTSPLVRTLFRKTGTAAALTGAPTT